MAGFSSVAMAVPTARAARAMRGGAGFSLRDFHDELLSHGSMPIPMVARHMLGEGT